MLKKNIAETLAEIIYDINEITAPLDENFDKKTFRKHDSGPGFIEFINESYYMCDYRIDTLCHNTAIIRFEILIDFDEIMYHYCENTGK